jgi:hypothetical protein
MGAAIRGGGGFPAASPSIRRGLIPEAAFPKLQQLGVSPPPGQASL